MRFFTSPLTDLSSDRREYQPRPYDRQLELRLLDRLASKSDLSLFLFDAIFPFQDTFSLTLNPLPFCTVFCMQHGVF